jgi:hypothetical protein
MLGAEAVAQLVRSFQRKLGQPRFDPGARSIFRAQCMGMGIKTPVKKIIKRVTFASFRAKECSST